MTIFRDVEIGDLLLVLRNDIAASSEHADWALWFKYGAQAALLHVDNALAQGVEPQNVLADLRANILRLEQDREGAPDTVDIWPMAPRQQAD
ncbi:MAG TPA: hypothetical protein VGH74_07700 [Planctomycetaceae bacterium]|jgi:hypothetical protein